MLLKRGINLGLMCRLVLSSVSLESAIFCVAKIYDLRILFIQGNCNFDTNFCFWSNDLLFSFTWTQQSYDTSSWDTGPSADHTTGDVRRHANATSSVSAVCFINMYGLIRPHLFYLFVVTFFRLA